MRKNGTNRGVRAVRWVVLPLAYVAVRCCPGSGWGSLCLASFSVCVQFTCEARTLEGGFVKIEQLDSVVAFFGAGGRAGVSVEAGRFLLRGGDEDEDEVEDPEVENGDEDEDVDARISVSPLLTKVEIRSVDAADVGRGGYPVRTVSVDEQENAVAIAEQNVARDWSLTFTVMDAPAGPLIRSRYCVLFGCVTTSLLE